MFQDPYTPLLRTLKQSPTLGLLQGGVKTKQDRRETWVGLEARHSDLGSLAVHFLDAGYTTFCSTQDGPHPLGFNFQVKDGESLQIQLSDL